MFVPSENQQAYFNWVTAGRGNAILEAVAGAGKTTTIVKGLDFMRGYIFLGAYNSKMAKELKERVAGKSGVTASTFHSAGLRALKFAFKNERLEVNANKLADMIQMEVGRTQDQMLSRLADVVEACVSMAKQRGIGAMIQMDDEGAWLEMIEHFGLADDLPDELMDDEGRILGTIMNYAQAILTKSNEDLSVIDFDDMVYLPLQRNIRTLQYDWVLIDEAQDTNPTRRALAKRLLKPTGRLVAVGDPHQAIFGFTGADNSSLGLIEREFKCVKMPLTISYRCPKAVVRHAQQWVSHIQAADSAREGQVITLDYKELQKTLVPGDAILCRYNKYLVNLCFKLIRAGVPARIEGRQIGAGLVALMGKWKVKSLNDLANRVMKYQDAEVAKAMKKGNESKADAVKDRCETVLVLIERAQEQGITSITELKTMTMEMFDDTVVDKKGMITLCSIHRSKGLEWPRVFILGRSELQPGGFTRQPWQMEQEVNLIYVAVTRAQETLYEVTGVKQESKQHRFGEEAA